MCRSLQRLNTGKVLGSEPVVRITLHTELTIVTQFLQVCTALQQGSGITTDNQTGKCSVSDIIWTPAQKGSNDRPQTTSDRQSESVPVDRIHTQDHVHLTPSPRPSSFDSSNNDDDDLDLSRPRYDEGNDRRSGERVILRVTQTHRLVDRVYQLSLGHKSKNDPIV